VRFRVRQLVVAVAVMAVLMAIGVGLQRRAAHLKRLSRSQSGEANRWELLLTEISVNGALASAILDKVHWHDAMAAIYERAAGSPWLPIAAAPPAPPTPEVPAELAARYNVSGNPASSLELVRTSSRLGELALGVDAEQRERDREVLETVLSDQMDPENPLNKTFIENKGRPGQGIVLDSKSWPLSYGELAHLALMDKLESKGETPAGSGKDLRRRNGKGPTPLKGLGIKDKRVTLIDLEKLAEESGVGFGFAEAFWKKYPDSWGHLSVYLPGYSSDGQSSVVVMDSGPTPHGMAIIYLLRKSEGVWKVKGRWREIFV